RRRLDRRPVPRLGLAVVGLDLLHQVDRRGERRGAGADEEDVDLHALAFDGQAHCGGPPGASPSDEDSAPGSSRTTRIARVARNIASAASIIAPAARKGAPGATPCISKPPQTGPTMRPVFAIAWLSPISAPARSARQAFGNKLGKAGIATPLPKAIPAPAA